MKPPIIIRCDQGSQSWHDVRLGIPTGSGVGKILTAKKLDLSSQSWKYRNQLLADWIAGYPASEIEASGFMELGKELEPRARAFYAMERGVPVEEVGFVMRADRRTGCSPDGLVGDDGGVEIKCPALHTHIGYLADPATFVEAYRGQVQQALYITGREWWDMLSFSTVVRPVMVRVEPEPEYHAALDAALATFLDDLDAWKEKLADYREQRPDGFMSPLPGEVPDWMAALEAGEHTGPVEAMAADARRLAGSNVR